MNQRSPRPHAEPPPPNGLDEARLRQQAIGARLRQVFDEIINEPVPDAFIDILRDADARQAAAETPTPPAKDSK